MPVTLSDVLRTYVPPYWFSHAVLKPYFLTVGHMSNSIIVLDDKLLRNSWEYRIPSNRHCPRKVGTQLGTLNEINAALK